MISDRLSNLHLLPPLTTGAWAPSQLHPPTRSITRRDGNPVELELPLFWYEPPWVQLPVELAGPLATAVANLDVVVSALHRDLSDGSETSELFLPIESDDDANQAQFLPRMTPYRAERYGFLPEDFDNTLIIEMRLAPNRDPSGRLAYSPEQMERWERPPEGSPIAGGGYVAAGSFPADVVTLTQARTKLDQLRRLAPSAATFVSIGPYRLQEQIAAALVPIPDGIIIRMDQPEIEGIQLAALVHRARALMDEQGFVEAPLWVVPGEVTSRDVAKLIALGASAVAIDAWCHPLIDMMQESVPKSRYDRSNIHNIPRIASQQLWDEIDQVVGLVSSISPSATAAQSLGTYHPRWAKACGVSLLIP